MIDYAAIRLKFITLAQQQIGQYLSQSGPLEDSPNVIPVLPNHKAPPYPYVTVDVADISEENGWESNRYINEDDHTVHEVTKTLMVHFRCYGGDGYSENDKSSRWIMNQLHGSFMFDTVRDDLGSTIGAGVTIVTPINPTPVRLADKFVDSAVFSVLINIIDSREDVNSTIISSVEAVGEVHPSSGGEAYEINVNVETP